MKHLAATVLLVNLIQPAVFPHSPAEKQVQARRYIECDHFNVVFRLLCLNQAFHSQNHMFPFFENVLGQQTDGRTATVVEVWRGFWVLRRFRVKVETFFF